MADTIDFTSSPNPAQAQTDPATSSSISSPLPTLATTSPSDRIKQLNQIDKQITSLLAHASTAISTLSSPNPSRKTFRASTKSYHATLASIITSLRRQIIALELADIPLPALLNSSSSGGNSTASGVNGLDIGSISGRSDAVGRKMEEELWRKARGMIEDLGIEAEEAERVDLRMDVDGDEKVVRS